MDTLILKLKSALTPRNNVIYIPLGMHKVFEECNRSTLLNNIAWY